MTRSTRLCPGCVRPLRRRYTCDRCGYASVSPMPTIGEVLDGVDTREGWSGVDLGAYVRACVKVADIERGLA